MKRNYTLSTTDREAFLRAVDALAGVGTFTIHVIEVKEPPIASKPPGTSLRWAEPTASDSASDGAR